MSENNYTEIAKYYDLIVGCGYYDMDTFASEYISIIGPGPKSVLEIAMGTGEITKRIKDTYQVTGVDFSEPLLSIARQKLKGTNVQIVQCDVRDMSFDQKFDAALGHGSIFIIIESTVGTVMESFITSAGEIELTLRNIYNALKPNALFVLDFHAEHTPGKRFVQLSDGNRYEFEIKQIDGMNEFYKLQQIKDSEGKLIAQSTDHKLRMPIDKFISLAREVGFRDVETKTLNNKYFVLRKYQSNISAK